MRRNIRMIKGPEGMQTEIIVTPGVDGNVKLESIITDSKGLIVNRGWSEVSARGAYDFAQALNDTAAHVEDLSAPVDNISQGNIIAQLQTDIQKLKDERHMLEVKNNVLRANYFFKTKPVVTRVVAELKQQGQW